MHMPEKYIISHNRGKPLIYCEWSCCFLDFEKREFQPIFNKIWNNSSAECVTICNTLSSAYIFLRASFTYSYYKTTARYFTWQPPGQVWKLLMQIEGLPRNFTSTVATRIIIKVCITTQVNQTMKNKRTDEYNL